MSDERIDFVFLDAASLPWRAKSHINGVGLYYWHSGQQAWVWSGLIGPGVLPGLREKRQMPPDEAARYHTLSGMHGGPGA